MRIWCYAALNRSSLVSICVHGELIAACDGPQREWRRRAGGGTSHGPAPGLRRGSPARHASMVRPAGSGWPGAGRHREWQIRCRSLGMPGGGRIDQPYADPLECVLEQGGEVAAVVDDGQGEFAPQWVARHDPEVATDIGDDGADRAATDLGRDVLGRGQAGKTCVGGAGASVHRSGGARLATGWGARGGWCGRLAGEAAGQSGFERGGAKQAAGDAREDFPNVDGAEVSRDVGEVGGGGALLQRVGQLPAIVDQRADEGEEAPGAAGCVRAGGRPILVRIGAIGLGCGGRSGHERDENIGGGAVARNIFRELPAATPNGEGRGE